MIDKGQWREFGQDTGVTPLLFTRSAMGFLMTTESQDLGLTSHPKDATSGSLSAVSQTATDQMTTVIHTTEVTDDFNKTTDAPTTTVNAASAGTKKVKKLQCQQLLYLREPLQLREQTLPFIQNLQEQLMCLQHLKPQLLPELYTQHQRPPTLLHLQLH